VLGMAESLPEFRFVEYDDSVSGPNVVVDGSANRATVLTLSHWPGAPTPAPLQRDLSAEIAFAYLEHPELWVEASTVTNNHYDQDGLVSVLALVDPEVAAQHRRLLVDVAAAGDFGTYRDRRAARASMVIAAWGDAQLGYSATLPLLLPLALDPEPYRHVWQPEDDHLTQSEAAVADGTITISELPEIDLAVVSVPDHEPSRSGHRFAHQTFEGVHPMAVHNATERFRLLVLHGHRFRYVDRYETWVQYQSRPTLPRVDLRPLAERLTELDEVRWQAGTPGQLTPELEHEGESSLSGRMVTELVVEHLSGPENA
jgi:hypothetical protein